MLKLLPMRGTAGFLRCLRQLCGEKKVDSSRQNFFAMVLSVLSKKGVLYKTFFNSQLLNNVDVYKQIYSGFDKLFIGICALVNVNSLLVQLIDKFYSVLAVVGSCFVGALE